MLVKNIMTKNVVTVKPAMDVHKLAELFIKENISGAPVVNDAGQYMGIVLEEGLIFQDKRVHLPTFVNLSIGYLTLGTHQFEEEIKKIAGSKVADIMEKDAVTVSPQDSVTDLATQMIEKNIYYFPVLEGNNLLGVVTKRDIVRSIAKGMI
ncbi:MAG: CBS domain-containing protein [Candidatus Omnitrophota bacterium]